MNTKGFTLIELLVVVLIIGILASVALPQYTKAVEKSRSTEAITLLSNLAKAEEIYALATNSYTNDMNSLDIQMPNVTGTGTVSSVQTNAFTITIRNTNGANVFQATATRGGKTNAGSANYNYTIVARMARGGSLKMWCQPGTITTVAATAPALTGTTESVKMCKSIANGNANGYIMQ